MTTRTQTTNPHDMAERNAAPAVVARAVGQSQYLPEWSEPDWPEPRNRFWSSGYAMEIVNATKRAVRIERRHWKIKPNGGELETTDGAGIGGQVRLIRPGETFLYWSAAPLSGPDGGWMTGEFSGRFDDGEDVTIPVARFELAKAEGKPIKRDHDEQAARADRRELNRKLIAYIKKAEAEGFAVLDAADLPRAWQWEFKRFCIGGGNFNRHKKSEVTAHELTGEFRVLLAIDSDLIHTDRVIYTENRGFENLRLILTYRKPAQDWRLGGHVNESIQKLLETSNVPRHAWAKVSAELAYVLKVAVESGGKATVLRPPSKRRVSELPESSLEKKRERERRHRATYRQRLRIKAAASPEP